MRFLKKHLTTNIPVVNSCLLKEVPKRGLVSRLQLILGVNHEFDIGHLI